MYWMYSGENYRCTKTHNEQLSDTEENVSTSYECGQSRRDINCAASSVKNIFTGCKIDCERIWDCFSFHQKNIFLVKSSFSLLI